MSSVTNQIRMAMEKQGLNVEQLARLAGIHYQTVYKILRGGYVNLKTLEAVARALGNTLYIRPADAS